MNKIKTVLVFTLVIFVMGLCVPSVFGQAPQRARRPMLQNPPRTNLDVLNLTDEQKDQLETLRENQRDSQKQFMDTTMNLRQKLQDLRQDPAANAVEIEKIQDTVFNLKIEQMKKTHLHQKEIKKIFTPEQLEKMAVARARFSLRGGAALNRRAFQRSPLMRRQPGRGQGQMFGTSRFSQRGVIRRRR